MGIPSSQSLFPSEHSTNVFWHSSSLKRVGGQPDSFLYLGERILLPGCLKKSFIFEVQQLHQDMALCKALLYSSFLEHCAPASTCRFISQGNPSVFGVFLKKVRRLTWTSICPLLNCSLRGPHNSSSSSEEESQNLFLQEQGERSLKKAKQNQTLTSNPSPTNYSKTT